MQVLVHGQAKVYRADVSWRQMAWAGQFAMCAGKQAGSRCRASSTALLPTIYSVQRNCSRSSALHMRYRAQATAPKANYCSKEYSSVTKSHGQPLPAKVCGIYHNFSLWGGKKWNPREEMCRLHLYNAIAPPVKISGGCHHATRRIGWWLSPPTLFLAHSAVEGLCGSQQK